MVLSSRFSHDVCITNVWPVPSFHTWKRAGLQNRPFSMSSFAPDSLNYVKNQRSETRSFCHALNLHSHEMAQLKKIFFFLQNSFQCCPVYSLHQGVIYFYHLLGVWFIMWFILVVLHEGFLRILLVGYKYLSDNSKSVCHCRAVTGTQQQCWQETE